MTRNCKIYGLADPNSKQLRYIGKTVLKIETRLLQHLFNSRRSTKHRLHRWIRSLEKQNLEPEIFLIEEHVVWTEAEPFWIAYFKSLGCRLLNICSGGQGIQMTPEIAKKISKTRKEKGLSVSKETLLKNKRRFDNLWSDPEFKTQRALQVSREQKKLWADPEHKKKMIAAQKRRRSREKAVKSGISDA